MWPELQAWDERLSAALVLPSALRVEGAPVSPKNSFFYGGHRYIFLLMEWAAHGIPWLLASAGCVWLSHRNKWNPRDQWRALVLLFGILLDLAAIGIIKLAVQRPRPPYNRDDQIYEAPVADRFSFPSGHSSRAGMLAVLAIYLPTTQSALTTLLASTFPLVLGYSRVAMGRHYVTDVIAGVALGVLEGFASLQLPAATVSLVVMLKQRRRDIQGLRAVAILAVLLFHVWPQWFPSGYLGVQMFFVLSGYLMAMILSDGSSETILQTITGFYYRRMKRIVPVYLLVINCVLASSFYLFCCHSSSFHTRFTRDALPALAFGTNVENILESDDYFGQTDQYRFFTHCWSLGVEMQFYVLAPFILLTISRLDTGTSLLVCALLAALSLLLQLASESVIAFNMVFCRIWQFTGGIAAFQVSDRGDVVPAGYVPVPDNLDSEEIDSEEPAMSRTLICVYYALLLGLCTCVFYVPENLRGLEAYACIVLTACLLAIGSRSDDSTVLTSIPMALTGDASYVLYLIHWPAIEWYKYQTGSVRFSVLGGTSLIVVVLVASLFLHLAVEKPIVRVQSAPLIIGLVLTLYLAAITLVYLHRSVARNDWFQSHSEPRVTEPRSDVGIDSIVKLYAESGSAALANLSFSKEEQIANNEQLEEYTHKWWENCPSAKELSNKYHLRRHITECKFEGRGNMTFLVMGNSHAKHNMLAIARAFEDDFSTMHVFERSACVPIEGLEDFAACRQFRRAMMDTVSRVRPDALFLIFKFMGPDLPELQEPLINDTIVARFQAELDELSQYAGTIFVGLPHLKFDYDVPMEIAKRLEMNQSLDSINLELGEYYAFHKNRFRMFGALKCTKCLWIDWTKAFCDKDSGVCDAYERNSLIGYFIDLTHYSVLGSLKALPLFEELKANWTRSRLLAA